VRWLRSRTSTHGSVCFIPSSFTGCRLEQSPSQAAVHQIREHRYLGSGLGSVPTSGRDRMPKDRSVHVGRRSFGAAPSRLIVRQWRSQVAGIIMRGGHSQPKTTPRYRPRMREFLFQIIITRVQDMIHSVASAFHSLLLLQRSSARFYYHLLYFVRL
jgi:hypothetical protein